MNRRWFGIGTVAALFAAAARQRARRSAPPRQTRGERAIAAGLLLGVVGLALTGLGLAVDPRQAYFSYLTAFVTGLSLAVGALLLLMIGHLTGANWLAPLRPLAEATAATLPAFAVLFLPIVAGMSRLYPWVPPLAALSAATRESIEAKQLYLNVPFFLIRTAIYFAIWIGVASLLRRWSVRLPAPADRWQAHGHAQRQARQRALSAGALPPVAFAFTFASFDWTMSLSPAWFSTIYGVYIFAGGFLAALALLAAAAPTAQRTGLLPEVPLDSYHALGKLLLTFVIFWAYIAFSQFLIIWIGDVPKEVAWYVPRIHGSWGGVILLLLAGNFLAPFLLLLFRRIKRTPATLAGIGAWLLVMHFLDVHWLVMPERYPAGVHVHWLDLATLGGIEGMVLAYGAWRLRRHVLGDTPLPNGDVPGCSAAS